MKFNLTILRNGLLLGALIASTGLFAMEKPDLKATLQNDLAQIQKAIDEHNNKQSTAKNFPRPANLMNLMPTDNAKKKLENYLTVRALFEQCLYNPIAPRRPKANVRSFDDVRQAHQELLNTLNTQTTVTAPAESRVQSISTPSSQKIQILVHAPAIVVAPSQPIIPAVQLASTPSIATPQVPVIIKPTPKPMVETATQQKSAPESTASQTSTSYLGILGNLIFGTKETPKNETINLTEKVKIQTGATCPAHALKNSYAIYRWLTSEIDEKVRDAELQKDVTEVFKGIPKAQLSMQTDEGIYALARKKNIKEATLTCIPHITNLLTLSEKEHALDTRTFKREHLVGLINFIEKINTKQKATHMFCLGTMEEVQNNKTRKIEGHAGHWISIVAHTNHGKVTFYFTDSTGNDYHLNMVEQLKELLNKKPSELIYFPFQAQIQELLTALNENNDESLLNTLTTISEMIADFDLINNDERRIFLDANRELIINAVNQIKNRMTTEEQEVLLSPLLSLMKEEIIVPRVETIPTVQAAKQPAKKEQPTTVSTMDSNEQFAFELAKQEEDAMIAKRLQQEFADEQAAQKLAEQEKQECADERQVQEHSDEILARQLQNTFNTNATKAATIERIKRNK